jgi:TRAP-type transport system periplasmic protein
MKSPLSIAVTVLLATVLVFSACSSPGPSPSAPSANPSPAPTASPAPAPSLAPVPSSAPAPAPTAAGQTFKFIATTSSAVQSSVSAKAMVPFFNRITDVTKGRVQFEVYYTETLAKQNQAWQAVQNGVADIGFVVQASYPGLTPNADVATLPFLTAPTAKSASGILWKLYDKFPSIQADYKTQHVLVVWATGPAFLCTTKKELKTMADLKGLRMKTGGGLPVTQGFQALGVAPITMSSADTYMNLQKGVIDGGTFNWDNVDTYKLYEVCKYFSYAPYYSGNFSLVMNLDKWKALPKDVQDQINSVCGLSASEFFGTNEFDIMEAPTKEQIKKAGYTIVESTMPQSEIDKGIAIAGNPIWDRWIKDRTAAGVPESKDMVSYLMELLKAYK